MNEEEWEALCDGCGKCCLHKLEDSESGEITYTRVVCKLLDLQSCQCKNYSARHIYVPDCIPLDMNIVRDIEWLPKTCSYRLLYEGKPLPRWHYLVCGNKDEMHKAGASVQGRAISENRAKRVSRHIVDDNYWD